MRPSPLRRLCADARGNIAVLFAITLLPLLLVVGFAVDSSRMVGTKHHMQAALDAASLAGARAMEDEFMTASDIRPIVENAFYANLETSMAALDCGAPDISIDTDVHTVSVDATC